MNDDIVLGLWSQGDSKGFHSHMDARKAKGIIKTAYKRGIRAFDTAFSYKESNSLLYSALKEIGVRTEDVGITLKIMPVPSFLKKVESSLRALGTGHVESILIHWPAGDDVLFPTLSILEKLVSEGVCTKAGVSNFPLSLLRRVSQDFELSVHQRPVSAIWRKDLEGEFLPLQGYGPLGFGTLCRMDRPEDARGGLYMYKDAENDFSNLLSAIQDISCRHSAGMADIAFSHSRSLFKGETVIGVREESQLDILGKDILLDTEEKELLDRLSEKLIRFQTFDNIFSHDWRQDGHAG